jgi:multidrug efflux system outer membrane protein
LLAGNFVASLALALAGCAVGPDYQRPVLDVPSTHRGADAAAGEKSLADLEWSQVFDDPVLVELIDTALTNNFDLRTAAARVDEYRAYAGVARGALFPQVGLGVGYNATNGSLLSDPALTTAITTPARNCPGSSTCSAACGARTKPPSHVGWPASKDGAASWSR